MLQGSNHLKIGVRSGPRSQVRHLREVSMPTHPRQLFSRQNPCCHVFHFPGCFTRKVTNNIDIFCAKSKTKSLCKDMLNCRKYLCVEHNEMLLSKRVSPSFLGRFLARKMGPGVCLSHRKWWDVLHLNLSLDSITASVILDPDLLEPDVDVEFFFRRSFEV